MQSCESWREKERQQGKHRPKNCNRKSDSSDCIARTRCVNIFTCYFLDALCSRQKTLQVHTDPHCTRFLRVLRNWAPILMNYQQQNIKCTRKTGQIRTREREGQNNLTIFLALWFESSSSFFQNFGGWYEGVCRTKWILRACSLHLCAFQMVS